MPTTFNKLISLIAYDAKLTEQEGDYYLRAKTMPDTISLRNITLAYTLPKDWTSLVGIESCRLNFTCQNAISFTSPYPDHFMNPWAGAYGKYPNLRKYTLGVNISF